MKNQAIPQTIKQFQPVNQELKQVRSFINHQIKLNGDDAVAGLVKGLRSFRGKMIRPAILLLSGKCFGRITSQHIKAAAAAEMLHNATLLHDDVIDDGSVRRGMPTINSLYGNEKAVLLGDFLLSKMLLLCNGLEPEINKNFASATYSLCRGELTQTANKRNFKLSEKEYIKIITEKTAALFRCCCLVGADLCGAEKEDRRRLADFGLNFGIAFQISDDLNDLIGSEKKNGKTTGADLDKNKPTLAVIHLLSTLSGRQRSRLIKKLQNGSENGKTIKKLLNSSGSIDYTKNKINHYIGKAIITLGPLNNTNAGKALAETARLYYCS